MSKVAESTISVVAHVILLPLLLLCFILIFTSFTKSLETMSAEVRFLV